MATHKFIIDSERAIIETIEAIKLEACTEMNMQGRVKVYPENFEVWYSLKENTELLLDELNKYVRKT